MDDASKTPGNAKLGPHSGMLSLWANRAREAMLTGKPGDLITLNQMSQIVGRNCHSGFTGYGNVQSAIRNLLRTTGAVWRWSKELQGWKCLEPNETASYSSETMGAARRRARKAIKIGMVCDRAKLNSDQLRGLDLTLAQASLMDVAGGASVRKKLDQLPAIGSVDAGKVLDLFRGPT